MGLMFLLAACGTQDPVCTEEFRVYGVFVTDTAGSLLPGLEYSVRIANLGQDFEVDSLAAAASGGFYPVITDAEGALVGQSGSLVEFTATDSMVTAEADFLFVAGVCHVEKVSGPDTVVAQ